MELATISIEWGQLCPIINSLRSSWADADGAGNPGHRGRLPLSNVKLSSDGGQLLLLYCISLDIECLGNKWIFYLYFLWPWLWVQNTHLWPWLSVQNTHLWPWLMNKVLAYMVIPTTIWFLMTDEQTKGIPLTPAQTSIWFLMGCCRVIPLTPHHSPPPLTRHIVCC